ncbi:protein CFAP20DC [Stegastes partitus]|uniref:Protein CFAP20DC n=1 Tax=Stegastes partitus TaxID=144197 RepID=A0A9Y4K7N5_9TELE|nr:PREDICTED: uncharacterized protein C3orf67 homolog [Stegastes partitus]
MFRNNYQGGAVVEIFSGQGKDPVAKWKLCGGPSAIHKEYNKEVKGFVYCLEGSSQTVKMQIPENGKMSLGLLQRFLVLQVNIPQCSDFSAELVITDSEHLKRRLHMSTVHKELSATPLHAKIPFVGLKRNVWSTLCIDLVSLTGELFKEFLRLDGISLFATCKVRRIFTMKTEPTGTSDDDMFLGGAGLMDLIPRSCQYPPDVKQITQVLNMESLRKADMRTGLFSSDCVPDHCATARSTSYRRTRPQAVLHTASGSRASGPPPQTGRKSNGSSRNNPQVTTDTLSITNLSENLSHGEPSHILSFFFLTLKLLYVAASGSLHPHHDKKRVFDKQGSKKLRVLSAGREESSDERSCSPAKESSRVASTPAESRLCSMRSGLSSDLQVWSSWESNEGSEPQLTLQEEVFTFSSHPHSPKRGQGQGDQDKMEMGDDLVQNKSGRRYDAKPEDDFIGSESDEDKSYTMFQRQNTSMSNPATPRTPEPALGVQHEGHSESPNMDQIFPEELCLPNTSIQPSSSGKAEPAIMVPARCLSPNRHKHKSGPRGSEEVNQFLDKNSSVSLSRRLLQEVKLGESKRHKVEEEDEALKPVESSHYDLHLLGSLRIRGDDDEELRMLASLKREQEEDECRASGLSASQIHQCNVSISVSSDDTSTWTRISMPANQGHHYQKEMTPLLQSNPREWMDVLSPPIMPPSQQRRSGNTWSNRGSLVGEGDESVNEDEDEDEYLNLLYDPCLNCYFDPKTGKYYELA